MIFPVYFGSIFQWKAIQFHLFAWIVKINTQEYVQLMYSRIGGISQAAVRADGQIRDDQNVNKQIPVIYFKSHVTMPYLPFAHILLFLPTPHAPKYHARTACYYLRNEKAWLHKRQRQSKFTQPAWHHQPWATTSSRTYNEVGHSTGCPRKLSERDCRVALRHLANQDCRNAISGHVVTHHSGRGRA